jgi:hypothetical protein
MSLSSSAPILSIARTFAKPVALFINARNSPAGVSGDLHFKFAIALGSFSSRQQYDSIETACGSRVDERSHILSGSDAGQAESPVSRLK